MRRTRTPIRPGPDLLDERCRETVEALVSAGVHHVFQTSDPSSDAPRHALAIAEALSKKGIRSVAVRHASTAAIAAPVCAELSGQPAASLVVSSDGCEVDSEIALHTPGSRQRLRTRAPSDGNRSRPRSDAPLGGEERVRDDGLRRGQLIEVLAARLPPEGIALFDSDADAESLRPALADGTARVIEPIARGGGVAFPAALGACAAFATAGVPSGDSVTRSVRGARSARRVCAISGVASFEQRMDELLSAVYAGMDLTQVVVRSASEPDALRHPNLAAYAQLCGAWGRRVVSSDDLEPVLASAFDTPGPALVECVVTSDTTNDQGASAPK